MIQELKVGGGDTLMNEDGTELLTIQRKLLMTEWLI